MQAMYEKMGGVYSLGEDGIYYPDLEVTEEIEPHYGKYGMMRNVYKEAPQSLLYESSAYR